MWRYRNVVLGVRRVSAPSVSFGLPYVSLFGVWV